MEKFRIRCLDRMMVQNRQKLKNPNKKERLRKLRELFMPLIQTWDF